MWVRLDRGSGVRALSAATVQRCLACGKAVNVHGAAPGKQFQCPHCGTERVIGRASGG